MKAGPRLRLVVAVAVLLAAATAIAAVRVATPARDPEFGIEAPVLSLRRHVEMFQWHETLDAAGLPQYYRDWSDRPVDAGSFALPQGHGNPPFPFDNARFDAVIERDGHPVDPAAWGGADGWQALAMDPAALPANLAASFVADGGALTSSADPAEPEVGDLRIRWTQLPLKALPELELVEGRWRAVGDAAPAAIPGLPERGRGLPPWWTVAVAALVALGLAVCWLRRRRPRS